MKQLNPLLYALLLCSLFMLGACDRASDDQSDAVEADEYADEDPLAHLTPEERAAYDMAVAELEPALGDDIDSIQLLSITTTQWPDSSLGCPQPGVEYLQVITPGHSVRIGAKGRTYVVNTGGDQAIVCNLPGAGVMTKPRQNIHATEIASVRSQAINDLADQLGVDPSLIQASQLIPANWTDASMGCPEPGVEYEKKPVSGFRLFLVYQDRNFSYNTDGERVIACPPISKE